MIEFGFLSFGRIPYEVMISFVDDLPNILVAFDTLTKDVFLKQSQDLCFEYF